MIAFAKVRVALASLTLAVTAGLTGLPSAAEAAELIVFGSRSCPYCLAWEREVGRTYARTAEAQQAPLRRLDINGRLPGDLAQLRDVDVTPTFVLADEGREVGRIVGYSGRQDFWAELHRLLAKLHPKEL